MEEEAFFSGYCRQTDEARTVGCVFTCDGAQVEADCCYPDCRFLRECSIAAAIDQRAAHPET